MLHHMNRAAAGNVDKNFDNVVLLLHGNGTNGAQNNTFIDSSTNNFTITRNGNTTQGSFSPYSNLWSNYFDGNGDFLQSPSSTQYNFGTGDFTIEFFVFPISGGTAASYTLLPLVSANGSFSGTSNVNFDLFYDITGGNRLVFGRRLSSTDTSVTSNSYTIPFFSWVHIAVVRSSGTIKFYANGVDIGGGTFNVDLSTTQALNLGVRYGGATPFSVAWYGNMYLSNVRIVKGTAVYTSNFTPPAAPLTAITNTSLLTCQSNRFIDNSSNNFTITRNGDVSVQRFNPFNPTLQYSTAMNGGSGYFDGSGDYLNTSTNGWTQLSTGNFTLEAWCYINSYGTYFPIFEARSAATASAWGFGVNSSGYVDFLYSASRITDNVAVGLNTWVHLAVVRNGSTITLYVNGTSRATVNYALAINGSNTNPRIGGIVDPVSANGYISNARVVIGTAVYTSNFTPPAAPLTAITNTSLLCNFTNAAIIDNAMMNNLETVGNAQISTSVKRFGTGSISFDGTGDWLTAADNVNLRLGTGNFTIEFWVYRNASGTYGLVGKGTSTTGWLVSLNSSNQVVFTYGSSTITSTGTVAATTWTHIAVVREGTGTNQTKIYIGGTNDGTGTVSTDFTQTNILYVGADRTGASAFNGYLDDVRITKGVARYTTNFTAPQQPFQDR